MRYPECGGHRACYSDPHLQEAELTDGSCCHPFSSTTVFALRSCSPRASLSQWLSTVRIWQSIPIGHLCSDSASSGWSFSGHVVHSSSYPPHPSSLSPLSGVRLNMASLPATLGPSALFFRGLTNHLHVWIPVLTSTSQGTWVDTVRQLSTVADCFVLKYLLPFWSCKRVIYPAYYHGILWSVKCERRWHASSEQKF